MSIASTIAADFPRLLDEFGVVATIGGAPYKALVSEPDPALTLEDGGFDEGVKLNIKLLKASFQAGLPAQGTEVVLDGATYYVRTASDKPGHPITVIELTK